jgi:hypothetical protein
MKHLFAWVLSLLLSVSLSHADDSYKVVLHRPVKVGDRFNLAAKVAVDMHTKTIMNADEVEEEEVVAACKLAGELTILSTTPKGLAKELRLKLSEAVCMNDDEEGEDFFKAGDVIYLRHDNPDKVVQVNGAEPDETQSEIIDSFLFVQGDGHATDDELLGAPGKVKPGESWPVNREAMLKDWISEGFAGLRADDLRGKTTLSEITKLDGKPAARLRGEFHIENADLRLPSLPEEIRAKRFKLEINDETELPLDPAALATRTKTDLSIESESAGLIESDAGQSVKVRVNLRQRCASELTLTPIE